MAAPKKKLDPSSYVIAEFRFAKRFEGGESLTDIADDAIVWFEREYGFTPKKWNLRMTVFTTDEVGGSQEFFFNPAGNLVIQHDKNHERAKDGAS